MLHDGEFNERLKKARLAGARHGTAAGRALRKTRVMATKTAAKGAKKTQRLVVKAVHSVLGSDEYKR
jgi:hypothetical protein